MNLAGLTREQAIELSREKTSWSSVEMRTILHGLKNPKKVFDCDEVRIGDIITANYISHPAMVISVRKGIYYCCCITSDEDCTSILMPVNCRFIKNSFFTSTVWATTESYAKENIIGLYDSKKGVADLRRLLKRHYIWLL